MQIILVPSGSKPARTLVLGPFHIVAGIGLLMCVIFALVMLFSGVFGHGQSPAAEEIFRSESYSRDAIRQAKTLFERNLKALAAQVGELQARMVRFDRKNQRLSEQAETDTLSAQGEGGPFLPMPLNEENLRQEIELLTDQFEAKFLELESRERTIRADQVRDTLLPTLLPVQGGARLGSPFGARNDPFGRGRSMHEGLDFSAPYGTSILAAADGVVAFAGYHPEFGNLVEVNHGGEYITRYAHMSAISVPLRASVRRGQEVGKLGSTGRSTGAHLHFEVRQNDRAIDPKKFLSSPSRAEG